MRAPIVILALVATPFFADIAVAQSKSAAKKESQVSEWFKGLEDRWNGWMDKDKDKKDKDNDKCDKNDKNDKGNKHDRDDDRGGKGRGHDDDRCDAPRPGTKPPTTPPPTGNPPPPPPPPMQTGAEISGVVYSDLNFNGARDAGEPALSGWTVSLAGGASAVTDANGMFKFSSVTVGSYVVCATAQSGWSQIMPSRGEMCDSGSKGFLIDVLADAPNAVFSGKDFSFTNASGG
jgi:hypothetical protein